MYNLQILPLIFGCFSALFTASFAALMQAAGFTWWGLVGVALWLLPFPP